VNIVIDIGNTRSKLAVFNLDEMKEQLAIEGSLPKETIEAFTADQDISDAIICTVGRIDGKVLKFLNKKFNCILFDQMVKVPLKVKYTTPATLGYDRLAAAVAAVNLYPGRNLLVIDAGSCVTFDLVNSSGEYLGGAISPGIDMRYRSLNEYTDKLPLLDKKEKTILTGTSTDESISSGVLNGIRQEIKGIVNEYRDVYSDLVVLLTGGDIDFFEKVMENYNFADRFLVLRGLNDILMYNASKK